MSEEQKQALIEHCQRVLKGSNTVGVLGEVYQIALAALTAQPIKLAKDLKLSEKAHRSHCDYAEGYNDRAEMDRAAIRAAGYEVQE